MDLYNELSKSCFFSLEGDVVVPEESVDVTKNTFENIETVVIDKKFRLQSLLGKGGMGEVYLARHLLLDKDVALKIFGPGNTSEDGVLRFQREAQSIAKLNHKNVIHIYDFGISEDGIPYYTMEYLVGDSLFDRLATSGPLDMKEALEFFIQICNGLALAHSKGIIHRDLKPGNLFIEKLEQPKNTEVIVKIVDFGIASLTDQSISKQKLTTHGTIFGSPLYISPEQAVGQPATEYSDIYSLGCTLFEALVGRPPFYGETARQTLMMHQIEDPPKLNDVSNEKEFPIALEQTIATMLAKTPEQRQPSVLQVAKELKSVLAEFNQREKLNSVKATEQKLFETDSNATLISRKSETKSKKTFALTKNLLSISCVSGLVLVLAFLAQQLLATFETNTETKVKQSKSGAKTVRLSEQSKNKPLPTAPLLDSKSSTNLFTSEVKQRDGRSFVQFKFPHGVEMGTIGICLKQADLNIDRPDEKVSPVSPVTEYPIMKPPAFVFEPSMTFMQVANSFEVFPPDFLLSLKNCRILKANSARIVELIGRQRQLVTLDLAKSEIEDRDLKIMQDMKKLLHLRVDDTAITDVGLAQRPEIAQLRVLSMSGCKKASAVLTKLKNTKVLEALYVDDVAMTENDFRTISTFSNLKSLYVKSSGLNEVGLNALTSLKHLRELDVYGCPINTPKGVMLLRQLGKNGLKRLNVSDSGWSVTDRVLLKSRIPDTMFKNETVHRAEVPTDSEDLRTLLEEAQ